MEKNLVAEKFDQLPAPVIEPGLLRNEVTKLIFHNRHLVLNIGGKSVVKIPGITEAKKKTGRGKSFLAIDEPGENAGPAG